MSTHGLFTVKLNESRLRDVLPQSLLAIINKQPRQKALALLGDRLIDLKLYEQLLLEGEKNEVSKKLYDDLSMHERGTMVEAYIGALYEQCNYRMTQELSIVLETMIAKLRHFLAIEGKKDDTEEQGDHSTAVAPSQFKLQKNLKKAKSVLLEIMQKRGVTNASSFFSCRSLSASKTLPPFVATFNPIFDLSYCGLPDTGPICGDESITKKEAEESCSSKVLKLFREKEKQMKIVSSNNKKVSSHSEKKDLEEGEEGEVSEEDEAQGTSSSSVGQENTSSTSTSSLLGKRVDNPVARSVQQQEKQQKTALMQESKSSGSKSNSGGARGEETKQLQHDNKIHEHSERAAENIKVAEHLKFVQQKRVVTKERRYEGAKKYFALKRSGRGVQGQNLYVPPPPHPPHPPVPVPVPILAHPPPPPLPPPTLSTHSSASNSNSNSNGMYRQGVGGVWVQPLTLRQGEGNRGGSGGSGYDYAYHNTNMTHSDNQQYHNSNNSSSNNRNVISRTNY